MVATGQVVTGGGAPHTHPWSDVTGEPAFALAADLSALDTATGTALSGKASTNHVHGMSAVSGLSGELDGIETRLIALEEAPGGGGGGSSRTSARGYVTSGDLLVQETATWALLAGSPTFVIAAAAGDEIELQISCLIQPHAASFLDLAVVVSGEPVRYAATGTSTPAVEGAPSLYPDSTFVRMQAGPAWNFVAASGDLEGGNITLAFAVKSASGIGKVYAGTAYPLRWTLINHGAAA